MIVELPTGQPKLRFFLDEFEIFLIYSITTDQYNSWVSIDGKTIVEAKGLTVGTDLLEDTQYTQKITTVQEADINAQILQINYQR